MLILLSGFVVANDKLSEYKKACDGGEASGCFNLGWLYHNGDDVRQDNHIALELFGKACDLREQSGCKNYKILKNR